MSSKDLVLLSIKEPKAKSFHSAAPTLFSVSLFGSICIATKTGGTIKRPVEPSMLFTPFPLNISQSLCECWQWNRSDVQRFANRDSHRKAASRGICGAMTWSTMSLSVFSDKTAFSSHWARQIFNQPAMHLLAQTFIIKLIWNISKTMLWIFFKLCMILRVYRRLLLTHMGTFRKFWFFGTGTENTRFGTEK